MVAGLQQKFVAGPPYFVIVHLDHAIDFGYDRANGAPQSGAGQRARDVARDGRFQTLFDLANAAVVAHHTGWP
ncbi:MAG TPA: hypothetical protein VGC77_05240 [Rhodopseudomonas sp.]|uniref:hypothetical protein n=1 Tax=Rhodopseudomonas sp. TaxID=1078 RepID=UPI002ED9FDE8